MATTTNYGWTTPDNTDLVKDGASAIRTLGTSADSSLYTHENWTLLNAGGTALTGSSTVTVSNLGGYHTFLVLVTGGSSTSASAEINLRLNGDSSSLYDYLIVGQSGTSITNGSGIQNVSWMVCGTMGNSAANTVSFFSVISGCNGTGAKLFENISSSTGSTSNTAYVTKGRYLGTSPITSISCISVGGTLDAGTMFIYGAK